MTLVIMLTLLREGTSGGGADRIWVKGDVPRGWCWGRAYKTVCASFTLSFAEMLMTCPVSTSTTACPRPNTRLSWSLLAASRWAHVTVTVSISWELLAGFTRATSSGTLLPSESVWFGGAIGWVAPTAAAPFVFRGPPERLRLTLKVCERKVREDDRVLFVHVGDKRDGGCAARALPGARQRCLIYKVDHFVAAETPQLVLVALAAADHAGQVPEGVHAVLRASPFAVRVMVVVALLVVGDQAAPAPLVARQGGAVMGTHYHVLGGAPSVQVWGDPVAGPHVGFVVGVSSCRGHLQRETQARPFRCKVNLYRSNMLCSINKVFDLLTLSFKNSSTCRIIHLVSIFELITVKSTFSFWSEILHVARSS